MRLVTLGILAAMVGAGCAFQAGDPGGVAGGPTSGVPATELTTTQATPKVQHQTATSGSATAAPAQNPEPSPWLPGSPGTTGAPADNSNGMNPEPSPWVPQDPTGGSGTAGDPQSGGGSTTGNTTGSTPNHPDHLGTR